MARLTKFQQELAARSQPASAIDILDEVATRLLAISMQVFPQGITGTVGEQIQNVLQEAKQVKLLKAARKTSAPELTLADSTDK